jgi:hypothetical protein
MSDYAYVADRAKKAFASVARLENALARKPDDRATSINLASMKRMAEQARKDLMRLAEANRIEVCEYRMVPVESNSYGLSHVSKVLLEYQNLFSQIYDALKNGPKSKAVFGQEAEKESMLDFAYSYSGSLGVVLLARSERDFFEGNLDKPIEALYQILDISNIDSLKDISHNLGRAVIKRVHDWSEANVAGGFSADIQWKRSDGRLLGQMIDRERLKKIVELIGSTSDTKTSTIKIRAMLIGGNIGSKTFQLTVPDGETFSGQIPLEADLPLAMTLGRIYDAEIEVSETYYFATEKSSTVNVLRRMRGPLDGSKVEVLPAFSV